MRAKFLREYLERFGHECRVLNTGISRKVPSPEYETIESGFDYFRKVFRFSRAGYVCHVHANGKSPKGLALALAAEFINLIHGTRCVLTFHAGEQQRYFPRQRAPLLTPIFRLLFSIPRAIVCNSVGVKTLIEQYGVAGSKVFSIPAFTRQYLAFERVVLPGAVEEFYRKFRVVLFCYINIQNSYHPDVLLDAFALVASQRADVGLLVCGLMGHKDAVPWEDFTARIARYQLASRMCLVDDFDHDEFLTALTRSTLCVRTPPADGVSSSVLEALALQVPVVAAENGTRPTGVITYPSTNVQALASAILHVIDHRPEVVASIPHISIDDTLPVEARVLTEFGL
jgi:glycosyltransferase involved in cell wall biosynthesis